VDDDEYSDDEKEAEAKKQRKQKKRGADGAGKGGPSAMRDGGLAAAAAAAGMGAGMPHYGNGPSRFQPKVPPAVQMAHMGIGGTQGVAHPPYAQAPQGAPMMMQTPAGMVPMMPAGHQAGGYVQTPQGLVQMVPMMMQPPGAPGQSYYQAPGQTNPPPPPPQ
jgi:H/ACA ribonucleoprotein complex non-core subunit NAF1